ncbi:MAG: hypothetical protein R3C68_04940 [Myxococcota bacterium]
MVNSAGLPLTEADLPAATVGVGTYTIGAAGELDKDADLDLWTLGKTTGIVHVASDL